MSERVKSTFSFQLAALISTVLGRPLLLALMGPQVPCECLRLCRTPIPISQVFPAGPRSAGGAGIGAVLLPPPQPQLKLQSPDI